MSIMNPKKITAIGITVLFLALVVVPAQGAIVKKGQEFPIELSMVNADGSIGSKIISLTKDEIVDLSDIFDRFAYDYDGLLDALKKFFRRCGHDNDCNDLIDKGILSILPGCPIISVGEGRQLLSRYHGRVQFKKLISTWSYPDNGFTMVIGNNLSPKQILFQRQMGIMVGFVGLYIYIPKVLDHQKAGITCFAGSALFAWGTSF